MDNLRSSGRKTLFGECYRDESVYTKGAKLPAGIYLIGRMISLCKSGQGQMSKDEASKIVADELRDDWISKTIYPLSQKAVSKRLRDDYQRFIEMRKIENHKSKMKSDSWYEKAMKFNSEMTVNAYDIKASDEAYTKRLETEYDVKMTTEDVQFYHDNCRGSYTARCTETVPRDWLKQRNRLVKRKLSEIEKITEMRTVEHDQARIRESELRMSLADMDLVGESEMMETDVHSLDISTPTRKPSSLPQRATRSGGYPADDCELPTEAFPLVKIRTGRQTLNEPLMRSLVQCLAQYKVTTNDLIGIVVNVANTVFGQQWTSSVSARSDEDEDSESEDDYQPDVDGQDTPKRRRESVDYTYVMPTRLCISNYLADASYINLEMVANSIMTKDDAVVTVGLDDTKKAAGHKLFDVKTDHITISGPSTKRHFLTTGYTENVSHSGEDGAQAYNFKLQCLATLANTTIDELKSQIDFWITDRAADCTTMLTELEVAPQKCLKCCAHVILGVDHSIDKVFRDAEQKIGIEKLIECDKILKSSASSVHTVGLIAITKLLSPSHASHSVSLYNEYTAWMEANEIDHNGFKGFISNRFGRIAELAKMYLKQQQAIVAFFDAIVDKNSNKLVLAVSTFVHNDWFKVTSEVYSLLGDILIFPIMDLLGIDRVSRNPGHHQACTWADVKAFFDKKIPKLVTLQERFSRTSTGKGRLIGAVLAETIDTVKRQLQEMDFFGIDRDEEATEPSDTEDKLQYAPTTNSGCESGFAKLNNRVKVAGGMTSIVTHSRKNIISTNGLLVNSEFTDQPEKERRNKWKWARTSDEVRRVKMLEADFLSTVKASKLLTLKRKADLKQKKCARMLKLLDKCKDHGGPITASSINSLKRLNERDLLNEIAYLRTTVAPDIRQKRRVKVDGKWKFHNFTVEELRQSIRAVIKPENQVGTDVETLLKVALV